MYRFYSLFNRISYSSRRQMITIPLILNILSMLPVQPFSSGGAPDSRRATLKKVSSSLDGEGAVAKVEPTWRCGGGRKDYLSWDDYFMSVAFLSAMRSKDPSTQVGACIVNPDRRIVGIGYNGFPAGCSDDELPWHRTASHELDTKYPYVCHAEMNAILNKISADIRGCTIYVALFPCADCTKLIIQSGITRVVYVSDKYHDAPTFVASRRMLDLSGVKYDKFIPASRQVLIDFDAVEEVSAEDAGIGESH